MIDGQRGITITQTPPVFPTYTIDGIPEPVLRRLKDLVGRAPNGAGNERFYPLYIALCDALDRS